MRSSPICFTLSVVQLVLMNICPHMTTVENNCSSPFGFHILWSENVGMMQEEYQGNNALEASWHLIGYEDFYIF